MHTLIGRALQHAARSIDLECVLEPPTRDIISSQYTDDQLRVMLPKAPNAQQKAVSEQALDAYIRIQATNSESERAMMCDLFKQLVRAAPLEGSLIHLDGVITREDGTSVVFDHTTVHTTCPSYRRATLEFLCQRHQEQLRAPPQTQAAWARVDTPALAQREKLNHLKYAPLMHLLGRQAQARFRLAIPTLLAPVFSHNCEFSQDTLKLVHWLTVSAARRAKRDEHVLGVSPRDAARAFRTYTKDALANALAKGVAEHLMAAMIPTFPPAREDDRGAVCRDSISLGESLSRVLQLALDALPGSSVQGACRRGPSSIAGLLQPPAQPPPPLP